MDPCMNVQRVTGAVKRINIDKTSLSNYIFISYCDALPHYEIMVRNRHPQLCRMAAP